MQTGPKTFDWVKAHADCSIEQMFLLLGEVIDSDVYSCTWAKSPWRMPIYS